MDGPKFYIPLDSSETFFPANVLAEKTNKTKNTKTKVI